MKKRFYNDKKSGAKAMISKDTNSFANMPQDIIMKDFPKNPTMGFPDLDDSMAMNDSQNTKMVNQLKQQKNPSKY